MTKQEKLKHCVGCEQNFYNGNNPLGVGECWHLKNAELVERLRIGVWERPPYDKTHTIRVFQCREEKGNCLIRPEVLTTEGYWR